MLAIVSFITFGALVLCAAMFTVAEEAGAVCLRHNGNVSLEIRPAAAKG